MNNALSKEIEKIIEDCQDVDYGEDSATLIFYNSKAIEQLLQLVQQESRREAIEFNEWANNGYRFMRDATGQKEGIWFPRNTYEGVSPLIKTHNQMYDDYLLHKQNKEQ